MSKGGHHWGKRKARWYSEGLRYSGYADNVVGVMEPIVRGCSSLLDVGAGCGALSIPLATTFERVLAVDSSAAMLDELREVAAEAGASGIETELATWDEAEGRLGKFDVVLCANVPGAVDNPTESIPRLQKHANRYVFLVLGTPQNANKFYFQELFPLIHGTAPPEKADYFDAYSALYDVGVFANVAILDYNFDQPFADIDEAILFWKEHMRLDGDQWDDTLKQFLAERLEESEGQLWARLPKQSAVVWWRVDEVK